MLVNKHDYYVSDDNGVCAQLFPQQKIFMYLHQ